MTWPEYLQGYAGLGILQTLSCLIRAGRVVGGTDAPVNRGKEEGELHGDAGFKGNSAFIYLPISVGQLIDPLGYPFQVQTPHFVNAVEPFSISQTCI